ncbi:MAG: hypothetical protein JW819_00835 [Candidatus Krumholzibacteriota bacterium]|nr:hypothetical protein [Candidatus Krumholzibacteriota bacterium]
MAQHLADDLASRRLLALLRRELRRARRAHRRAALPAALAVSALALIVAALALRAAPPETPAAGLAGALAAWLAALLPWLAALAWPFLRLPDARRLLAEAERRAGTRQLLETAADVAEGRLAGKGYSPALMDRVLERAASLAAVGLPPAPRGPWSRRVAWASAGLAVLAAALLVLPSPAGIRPAAFLTAPRAAAHYAERAWLELAPGDVEILAGSPLRLELRERGLPWRFAGALRLEIDETGDLFRPTALRREGDTWVHEIDAVHQGLRYRALRGRSRSPVHTVRVFHPPVLDSLRLAAVPPAYTGLPRREVDLRSGELTVPAGSRLELDGIASAELDAAWLRFETGDSLPLAVAGRRLSGALAVTEPEARLAVGLRDTRGTVTLTPPLLGLRAVPDRPPRVEFLAPPPDAELSRDLLVDVELAADDDYGVTGLDLLAWKRGEDDTLRIPAPLAAAAPRASARLAWDLGDFPLFPGNVVEYLAEARDNRPGAPGVGRSRVQVLRVPSVAEIYAEIEAEDEARGEDLADLLEEGRDLQEDLRRLERELRADPEVDWERRQELEDAFRRQEGIAEQLGELSRELRERTERLGENEMLRDQMAEKLARIEDLMRELRDTAAGEILRKFQEMLDRMDAGSLPDELQELRLDQEAMLEQLERTEAMLERIRQEQKMDGLLRRVDEMLAEQEALRAETEARSDSARAGDEAEAGEEVPEGDEEGERTAAQDGEADSEELAERQEDLADQAEELTQEIEETAEELSEDFPEVAEEMEDAARPESETDPAPPMRDAGEKMRQQDPNASDSQQDAMSRLLKLYWRLAQAQSQMSSMMDMEAQAALGEVTRQALELSLREEDRQSEIGRLTHGGGDDTALRPLARRQMDLYQSLERVRERLLAAAAVSFAISPRAMAASREALDALGLSVAELEAGRGTAGYLEAGRAVENVNLAVIELLHGMQAEGQGSGSCSSPLASMQRLLQRQEQLNRDTRGMGDVPGLGGLSMEERARMERLKAEQEAIREGLDELSADEEAFLGRLDQIEEDMREVERDLASGRIDEDTRRRQERIFERLLDAQRSVHKRDYKRRRESRTADEIAPLWPGDGELPDPLAKLRDEIRRGLGGAAPPEYEALIQEYYRSLLRGGEDAGEEELP